MKGRLILIACLLAGTFGVTKPVFAQQSADQVKTLFVYNFTRYIQWSQADKEITIGILGDDNSIVSSLTEMAARKSTGIKISVKQFNNPAEAGKFNMVYIPENNSNIIGQMGHLTNTLVITEKPGLTKKGSDINFIIQDGKVKFEINKDRIDNTQFKISGKLLGLGILV